MNQRVHIQVLHPPNEQNFPIRSLIWSSCMLRIHPLKVSVSNRWLIINPHHSNIIEDKRSLNRPGFQLPVRRGRKRLSLCVQVRDWVQLGVGSFPLAGALNPQALIHQQEKQLLPTGGCRNENRLLEPRGCVHLNVLKLARFHRGAFSL